MRIDRREHDNKIDDEIIAEIRRPSGDQRLDEDVTDSDSDRRGDGNAGEGVADRF